VFLHLEKLMEELLQLQRQILEGQLPPAAQRQEALLEELVRLQRQTVENQRESIEQQRIALEQQRLAIEQQRISVEQQRIAVQRQRLALRILVPAVVFALLAILLPFLWQTVRYFAAR
jgi:hypothetical protein